MVLKAVLCTLVFCVSFVFFYDLTAPPPSRLPPSSSSSSSFSSSSSSSSSSSYSSYDDDENATLGEEAKFHMVIGYKPTEELLGEGYSSMVMTHPTGEKSVCFLPRLTDRSSSSSDGDEKDSADEDGKGKPTHRKSVEELLKPLVGQCLYRQEGWWMYEFCYQAHIRQFHQEGRVVMKEFFLGVFNHLKHQLQVGGPKATTATTRATGATGATEEDGESETVAEEEPIPKITEDKFIIRQPNGAADGKSRVYYSSPFYADGTKCDLTNQHRELEVRYQCSAELTQIMAISEPVTCTYVLVVGTPLVCPHPAFVNKYIAHEIVCIPELLMNSNQGNEKGKEKKDSTILSDAKEKPTAGK